MSIKFGMTISEFYECTPRELYNFIHARREALEEEREHDLHCTRLGMWASYIAMNGNKVKPTDFLRLKRDGPVKKELTAAEKRKLEAWSKKCDDEMRIDGLLN